MIKRISILIIFLLIAVGYFIGSYFVDFALKRGNADDPNAIPAACESIHDASRTVPPMPAAPNKKWNITSADNLNLYADYFLPDSSSHKWAVLVHGYGRDRRFAYDYAEEYLKRGYNVLIPDLRASGESEGTYLTMGAKESDDILIWIDKIINEDSQAEIILHGVSMGAATVMLTAAKETSPNLKAVIEDCGYTSAYSMFTMQLDEIFNLPAFPIMDCVNIVTEIKTGVPLSKAAPIDVIKNIKVPIMFIHGTADKLVPYNMMQELYNACDAPIKETLTFEDVGHADAKSSNPDLYFSKIFSFLDKYADLH
ncbi:MAG: alpha/beta hydrolase [Selenomonadaceae bacterium]|nr:alpha/beta hydrolase [Selenomonadaceae bacterium]MBR1858003.1 alpha/beta hydrolase [Selenomonadaceae bacterium]